MITPVGESYPDEILRTIADRMAERQLGVLPVVDRDDGSRFVGLVTQFNLLEARQKLLQEELRRPDQRTAPDEVRDADPVDAPN